MKVLYALNSGLPGGMEQHVLDLVVGMVEADYEVFVWCNEGPVLEWYKKAGANVTNQKINFDVDPLYIFKLAEFLRDQQINIIHAHELKAVTNSLLAARLAGTKVKVTHTHTPISEWQIPKLKKQANVFGYSKLINALSDCEIALTESRKRVKTEEGINPEKLAIIHNGINTKKFELLDYEKQQARKEILAKYGIKEDSFIFGNVSRLTEEKGHEILIRAYAKSLEYKELKGESTHLLIAGGGKLEMHLKKVAEEMGILENVTITGRFEENDLVKLYASFDVFVFPTLAEGFGVVLAEAMASGLPVIVSNLEVLEEVGGSAVFAYFELGDAYNLAEKMLSAFIKRSSFENISESARERIRSHFSMSKFVNNYKSLYESLNTR